MNQEPKKKFHKTWRTTISQFRTIKNQNQQKEFKNPLTNFHTNA